MLKRIWIANFITVLFIGSFSSLLAMDQPIMEPEQKKVKLSDIKDYLQKVIPEFPFDLTPDESTRLNTIFEEFSTFYPKSNINVSSYSSNILSIIMFKGTGHDIEQFLNYLENNNNDIPDRVLLFWAFFHVYESLKKPEHLHLARIILHSAFFRNNFINNPNSLSDNFLKDLLVYYLTIKNKTASVLFLNTLGNLISLQENVKAKSRFISIVLPIFKYFRIGRELDSFIDTFLAILYTFQYSNEKYDLIISRNIIPHLELVGAYDTARRISLNIHQNNPILNINQEEIDIYNSTFLANPLRILPFNPDDLTKLNKKYKQQWILEIFDDFNPRKNTQENLNTLVFDIFRKGSGNYNFKLNIFWSIIRTIGINPNIRYNTHFNNNALEVLLMNADLHKFSDDTLIDIMGLKTSPLHFSKGQKIEIIKNFLMDEGFGKENHFSPILSANIFNEMAIEFDDFWQAVLVVSVKYKISIKRLCFIINYLDSKNFYDYNDEQVFALFSLLEDDLNKGYTPFIYIDLIPRLISRLIYVNENKDIRKNLSNASFPNILRFVMNFHAAIMQQNAIGSSYRELRRAGISFSLLNKDRQILHETPGLISFLKMKLRGNESYFPEHLRNKYMFTTIASLKNKVDQGPKLPKEIIRKIAYYVEDINLAQALEISL